MADNDKPAPPDSTKPPAKKPLFATDSTPAATPAPVAATPSPAPSPAAPPSPPTAVPAADDPLALTELFAGGGEPWLPLLKPTIERLHGASTFIGPSRDKTVVPVRELTFQALKPNPPERWNVVVFGQNPYPRLESATGIAMFDNTFAKWSDSAFGRVVSIRCIIKAAAMWKHGIPKATKIDAIRQLLAREKAVPPPEWFQAMLTQGVLLLNASLTASSDGAMATEEHTAFWRPVVERIVREILAGKARTGTGVVFAWWGSHARALRSVVERLQREFPSVRVRHLDHCNPAAQGDIFCDGEHFKDINSALESLGMPAIDWLPSAGWDKRAITATGGADADADADARAGEAGRMGDFIARTRELHKLFLERLQGAADEKLEELAPIAGVLATPLMSFREAAAAVVARLPGLERFTEGSLAFAAKRPPGADESLSADEVAALYLYTTESPLYRQLNAALRDRDRSRVTPYFAYLRLFISALSKLNGRGDSLYRGVNADLRRQYAEGSTVTWWGVSSCTPNLGVARAFLGGAGRRMLFEITPVSAISIRRFSAFTGEDEYILLPGARLAVESVAHAAGGLSTVKLRELAGERQLS